MLEQPVTLAEALRVVEAAQPLSLSLLRLTFLSIFLCLRPKGKHAEALTSAVLDATGLDMRMQMALDARRAGSAAAAQTISEVKASTGGAEEGSSHERCITGAEGGDLANVAKATSGAGRTLWLVARH